jgi:hypothetical protein
MISTGGDAITRDPPRGGGVVAAVNEVLVTTTAGQAILTYTAPAAGVLAVGWYFRVVTATTTVAATVSYTDAAGSQTLTLLSATAEPVGSYAGTVATISVTAGSTVSVVVTAGTANQVYAGAVIL